ncbi:MAG: hypothetical protein QXT28_12115 [Thermofilaceae archaeon]
MTATLRGAPRSRATAQPTAATPLGIARIESRRTPSAEELSQLALRQLILEDGAAIPGIL